MIIGSVRGLLNLRVCHDGPSLEICPAWGNPTKIAPEDAWLFPSDVIGRNVTVIGRLTYEPNLPNPVRVEKIITFTVHPDDSELPRLSDLRGLLCGEFGGKSTDAILVELREEDP